MDSEHNAQSAKLGGTTSEWYGLILAAATLVLVLLVCYMVVQLFKARRAGDRAGCEEGFVGWPQYRPACSAQWLSARGGLCKGLTTGEMPSIEEDVPISWTPCCGSLGVPPPTYD